MKIRILAVAAGLAAFTLASAQLPTKEATKDAPKPAARTGPVATVNGVAVPRAREEILLRERLAQGGRDSEQLRAAIRSDLINREVVSQEAARSGFTKSAQLQAELELVRQTVIVQAYIRDWVGKHPVSDAEVQKEYERAKAQTGDKEYKARHILVESEDEAKNVIAELKKGGKFDELAGKHSKDTGSRERGGDLDWNVPGVFDKQFSDAMVKLEKGKHSETPVRTRFGFHVIQLDDVRAVKFPTLAEVKPRIQQQLMQGRIDELVRGLRSKAKVE
jgi:peptidyl-prolyl cis-trans isomerase C